ncbi:MAG: hypothetical protein Q7K21_03740, partial [Elusimicrobiota bacterium]|nr:hypothetical protein [Elusimicrobiota bacterium]
FGIVVGIVIMVPYLYVLTYQERTLIDRNTGRFAINETTIKNSFYWLRGNAGDYTPDDDKYVNSYWQPPKLKELSISKTIWQNLKDSNLKNFITDIEMMVWAMWYGKGRYSCAYGYPGKQFWPTVSKIIFLSMGLFLFFKMKIYQKYKNIFIIIITWWFTYLIFVTWFNPGNTDYWYQHWMPILVLFACAIYEFLKDENISLLLRKATLGLFLCSVVIIPTVNFFDSIYPVSIAENNENYIMALFVKKYVKKGGVVIISNFEWNPGKVYIPYFVNVGRISFDLIFIYNSKKQGLQILKNQVEMLASQGVDIYTFDRTFDKITEDGLKQWNVTMEEIKEIFRPYEFKTLGVHKDGTKIMQMYPKKGSASYQRREGIKFYNLKDYKNASESFMKIPENWKTSFDYKLIGNCYILLNDKANAVSNWKKGYILNSADEQLREIIQNYGQ